MAKDLRFRARSYQFQPRHKQRPLLDFHFPCRHSANYIVAQRHKSPTPSLFPINVTSNFPFEPRDTSNARRFILSQCTAHHILPCVIAVAYARLNVNMQKNCKCTSGTTPRGTKRTFIPFVHLKKHVGRTR